MKTLTKTLLTLSIGLTLTSNSFAAKMYFSDSSTDKISRADFDGSNVEDIVTTGLNSPAGISIDVINSKIYWCDIGTDKIQRADFDGSNVEDIISSGLNNPRNLAIDAVNSKIYWCEIGTSKIRRSNLDGSGIEDLVTGIPAPLAIEIDIVNSKIYWCDNTTDKIQSSNLDGSSVEDVITTGLTTPIELALDVSNSKIYWTDMGTDKISRANFDGSGVEDLVTGLGQSLGLTIDKTNSKIYWTDMGTDKIQRANLDGSSVEDIITTGLSSPYAIEIDNAVDAPLSVELNSFSARQVENTIQLNWSTASETENEGFNIYRKRGNGSFIQISSYKSHNELLGQGNTSFNTSYTFVDNSKMENNGNYTYFISDIETSGLETKHEEKSQTVIFVAEEETSQTKLDYVLAQNFPNPFNPNTTINFQIKKDLRVKLQVYNLNGQLVKELVNEKKNKGSHSVNWNGTDSFGNQVSSGTYFYKITAGTFTQTNKMILLK